MLVIQIQIKGCVLNNKKYDALKNLAKGVVCDVKEVKKNSILHFG